MYRICWRWTTCHRADNLESESAHTHKSQSDLLWMWISVNVTWISDLWKRCTENVAVVVLRSVQSFHLGLSVTTRRRLQRLMCRLGCQNHWGLLPLCQYLWHQDDHEFFRSHKYIKTQPSFTGGNCHLFKLSMQHSCSMRVLAACWSDSCLCVFFSLGKLTAVL